MSDEVNEPEAGGGARQRPQGHRRQIDGIDFWCQPKESSGVQDPTRRTYTDEEGNEYWCIPYEETRPGRRYDSSGPIPPYPQAGVD